MTAGPTSDTPREPDAPDVGVLVEEQNVEGVRAWLAEAGPTAVRRELERLSPADGAVLFRLLPKGQALRIFEDLDAAHQSALLAGLRDDHVRQVVAHLDPDDRARLLDEMPAGVARRLLSGLSPTERRMTADLLGYPEDSAGRLMSPEVLRLSADTSVAEALAKIRRLGPSAETIYLLPVTDDERALLGITRLADLVLADPEARVGDIMQSDPLRVRADEPQEAAARLIQDADVIALPVVDHEERLVGVVTVDDAMDVIEAAESEDIARGGASEPLRAPYLTSSVARLARTRAAWLMLLGVAAVLTVNVLQAFEGALEEAVTLALFIPLLIGIAGNAGAQASTTIVRALALGDVRLGDALRVAWREVRVGLLLGGVLAVLGFLPASLAFGADIALVVSLTLVSIVTLASTVGAVLPLSAQRLGVDPAIVSAPIVTTLVDTTGLIIYFLIAMAVLGL